MISFYIDIMFYTEYRPQKFSELLGAEHVTAAITGSLKKGNTAHAYFFTGGRGIGKTTTARLLAKALNCQNPITETHLDHVHYEPCGECASCKAIQSANHLDLIEIDAASNRGIDDIRVLRENVGLAPTMGNRKIYIIDEVHMLTNEASNALLKTLEEPPTHAYFILCTTNPEKVLDTIKSRCIQINFRRPDIAVLVQKLRKIADDQKFEIADEDLEKVALLAKGAYREAETYLEQLINGEKNLEHLSIYSEGFVEITKMIYSRNLQGSIQFLNKLYANGVNIETWTEKYIEYLRNVLFMKVGVALEGSFLSTKEDAELSKLVSVDFLKDALKRFVQTVNEFKLSPFPTIPVELAVIDLIVSEGEVKNTPPPQNKVTPQMKKEEVSAPSQVEQKSEPIKEKDAPAEPKQEAKTEKPKTIAQTAVPSGKFPFKQLVESLKDTNHSIYLLLSSCKPATFIEGELTLLANYSFHKERVLSTKIRTIIEDAAGKLCGGKVVVKCELSTSNPDAEKLTDMNVTPVKKPQLEDVFYNVFGDELEQVAE